MTCRAAARYGHLEALKWVREHHCPWDEATLCHHRSVRALGGDAVGAGARLADVSLAQLGKGAWRGLRWAREHGCPWDEQTCTAPLWAGTWRC